MPVGTAATDASFLAEVTAQDKPVLAYFHDPALEVCEFMDLVISEIARERGELKIVTLDVTKNSAVTSSFSIPEPPVCMIFRDDAILGYRISKTSVDNLAAWIDRSLARPAEEGVKLDEFTAALQDRQERQKKNEAARLRTARNKSYIANAVSIAGGIAIASLFPPLGFGAIGIAISGYHAARSLELYTDKAREPKPATSALGQIFEVAGNLSTIVGSFGLLAIALSFSAAPAIAGVTVGTLMMLTSGVRFGHTIGKHLPLTGLLRGSLAQHAQERTSRNPDRPLEEFSPPKPMIQPEFPAGKEPSAALKQTFTGAGEGTRETVSSNETDHGMRLKPGGPQPG